MKLLEKDNNGTLGRKIKGESFYKVILEVDGEEFVETFKDEVEFIHYICPKLLDYYEGQHWDSIQVWKPGFLNIMLEDELKSLYRAYYPK
jgi:hypothetical protein